MMLYLNLVKAAVLVALVAATTFLPKDMVLESPLHLGAVGGGISLVLAVLFLDYSVYSREMPSKSWSLDSSQTKYLPLQVGFYLVVMLFFSFRVIQGADQIAFAWSVFIVFLGNVMIRSLIRPTLVSVTKEHMVKKDLMTRQLPLQSLQHVRYHKVTDQIIFEFKGGKRLSVRYVHLGSAQSREVIQQIRRHYKGRFTVSDELQKMIG
jgi:hypothetical protein